MNEVIVRMTLRRAAPPPDAGYATDSTLRVYPNGSIHPDRAPSHTLAGRSDNAGEFSVQVAGGLSGRYDFVVKPAGALSREVNSVNVQRGVAEVLAVGPFDEGDVDGDDDVDGTDFDLLLAAFGAGAAAPDARVDLDRDGAVTLLDFSLLSRSYGLAGPRQD